MKTAKISLTDSNGVVIALWEVQDMKGLSDKEYEDAVVQDERCGLLLYNSVRNEVEYLNDIQSELHWFFTQEEEKTIPMSKRLSSKEGGKTK